MKWPMIMLALLGFGLTASATPSGQERASERALLDRLAQTNVQGFAGDLEALAQRDPDLYEDMLDEQSERNPEAYEIYREFKASTAPNVDEYMTWATDEEIAADTVDEQGQPFNWDIFGLFQHTSLGGPVVQITVHLPVIRNGVLVASAKMDASGGGLNIHGLRVATGRKGHSTPRGCTRVIGSEKMHYSRKYNMAPMPYSTFFRPGIALHGGSVKIQSHGCVHLPTSVAMNIYSAVRSVGLGNAQVCVR